MIKKIPPDPLLFILFAIATAFIPACSASSPPRIILDPEPGSMMVRVHWPEQENQWFILLVPKSFGTTGETLMNFPQDSISWSPATEAGAFEGRHTSAGRFHFQAHVSPATDGVAIRVEVANLSDEALPAAWLFTFLAPHGAPAFLDPSGERTYLPVKGVPTPISDLQWPDSSMPDLAAFPVSNAPADLPAQVLGLNVTADTRPDEGWMVAGNEAKTAYIAYVSPSPLFLFRNRGISSLHVAPHLGDIPAGGSGTVRMRVLLGEGSIDDGIAAARRHLKKLEGTR